MTDTTLRIDASYENLNAAVKFAGEWAKKAQLDERAAYALQMAVDEACGNIIAHAYEGEDKGEILLAGRLIDEGLEVSLTDFGTDSSTSNSGEAGRFLIRQLMDDVSFIAENAQNILTLRKIRGTIE